MSFFARWRRSSHDVEGMARGRFQVAAVFLLRLFTGILGKFQDHQLHLQSTSLAYTTLLSLVPFLAVTFSVLKGFGVYSELEPMLRQALEPLGGQGAEISRHILTYVENLNFAVLGFFGIALLFWTVISLLTRVEEAFNAIWHVPGARSWLRRFSDYLSVALVGPVFIFSALGVSTVIFSSENVRRVVGLAPLDQLVMGLGRLAPYLLVCAAFAFLYAFLTNYRVRPIPALAGGIFASVAWYGVGHLFALLVAGSSNYSAIYSSMAAAVLFVIWINVGWLIILVGAHIARYTQHPYLLTHGLADLKGGQVQDEALALDIMALIGRAYHFDEPKWTLEALSARGWRGAPDQVEALLQLLRDGGLIVATNDEPTAYLPARSIETIALGEIVAAARARGAKSARARAVQEIVDGIDSAVSGSLAGITLKDLVLADDNPSSPALLHPREVAAGSAC